MASLARELGRMQLAEGRAAATLELLTRLEPSLAREADIWALRGNAAQRLGRHQDSLRAYTAALQLRPGEQRWMLGAAVSFAAMGQTANATEMVDKARALGPISKEVQAYLRQAGVAFTAP
jgi:Flp pilus assembly protein TadD